jgi:hypothetical protein
MAKTRLYPRVGRSVGAAAAPARVLLAVALLGVVAFTSTSAVGSGGRLASPSLALAVLAVVTFTAVAVAAVGFSATAYAAGAEARIPTRMAMLLAAAVLAATSVALFVFAPGKRVGRPHEPPFNHELEPLLMEAAAAASALVLTVGSVGAGGGIPLLVLGAAAAGALFVLIVGPRRGRDNHRAHNAPR